MKIEGAVTAMISEYPFKEVNKVWKIKNNEKSEEKIKGHRNANESREDRSVGKKWENEGGKFKVSMVNKTGGIEKVGEITN